MASISGKVLTKEDVDKIVQENPKARVMKYVYDAPVDKLNAIEAMQALKFIRSTYLQLREDLPDKTDLELQRKVLEACYEKELLGIRFANAYPLMFLRLTQRETTKDMIFIYEEMIRAKLNVDTGLCNMNEVTDYIGSKIMEYGSRKATEDEIAENRVKYHSWKDPLESTTVFRNLNPLPLDRSALSSPPPK